MVLDLYLLGCSGILRTGRAGPGEEVVVVGGGVVVVVVGFNTSFILTLQREAQIIVLFSSSEM